MNRHCHLGNKMGHHPVRGLHRTIQLKQCLVTGVFLNSVSLEVLASSFLDIFA